MLISITDPDLRTTANGGHVENVNGYDILFTLGDCSTLLSHQIEKYSPTTGELVVWVKIPTLYYSIDYGIHMYYGNASVAIDPSTSATWSAGFDGVWHLHNDFLDASGNTNNGTNHGSTDVSPAYNFGDGQNFVDPNNWIELTNHPNHTGSFSYSAWFRTNDRTRTGQRVICDDATNANGCHAISLGDPGTGSLRFYIRGLNPVSLDTPNLIANGVWYHVVVTYNNTTKLKALYLNGSLVASQTVTGTMGTPTGNASIGGEVAAGESANRFHGSIDEVHSFPGVLTASWIATEYNNQNSPSTFYTITPEYAAVDLCILLPIELVSFEATLLNTDQVKLEWITASESDNDHFDIERSRDGLTWETIAMIPGAGNSSSKLTYQTFDSSPYNGRSYYRLKQIDIDGNVTKSEIRTIEIEKNGITNIYPNPTTGKINIEGHQVGIESFTLVDPTGKDHADEIIVEIISENHILLDLSAMNSSTYYFKIREKVYLIVLN